jgi:uncharacterized protein YdaL
VIGKDFYGQRVLPESLGNVEYDSQYRYTAQDILLNAKYGKTVRDGYASFFFHPFLVEPSMNVPGLADFKTIIQGITQLGYTWIAPSNAK